MEAVAFISSVCTIFQVAETAAGLCGILYEVAREAKSIRPKVVAAAIQIEGFTTTLRASHAQLQYRCPRNLSSPVIHHLVRHRVLQKLRDESKQVRVLVQGPKGKLENISSRFDIVASWQWRRIKPELDALQFAMQGLKTDLLLVQNIVILELSINEKKQKSRHVRSRSSGEKTVEDLETEMYVGVSPRTIMP